MLFSSNCLDLCVKRIQLKLVGTLECLGVDLVRRLGDEDDDIEYLLKCDPIVLTVKYIDFVHDVSIGPDEVGLPGVKVSASQHCCCPSQQCSAFGERRPQFILVDHFK